MRDGDKILLGLAVALGLLAAFFLFKPRPQNRWVEDLAGDYLRL